MNNAERIYKELTHEVAAIWYISDEYGSKIMVKVPTPSIKAIIKGCKIELLFGRDEVHSIFHTGLKIHDDPLNPQMIFCTHLFLDQHLSVAKISNLDKVQIQFFNELNSCQVFGDLIINEKDRHEVLALLGNPKKLYIGEFTKVVEKSLDDFQDALMNSSPILFDSLRLLVVAGQSIKCESIQNYFYEDGVTIDTHISGNEGTELEKQVFAVIYSLFKKDTIRNPRIPYKGNSRELTDILAFSEFGIFLIETKALSVINTEDGRTMDRKVAGLQKQISKAINQLVGAMKKIAGNTPIYDADGNEVLFARTLVPHGIVLVSELLLFGEWDEIPVLMCKAMLESNSMIHVMDMKEFMQFIGYARGNKHVFDYYLMQRAKNFVRNPTLFQKTRFINELPDNQTQL